MSNHGQDRVFSPPATKTEDISDQLHGDVVVDTYRWLETDSTATEDWVASQNVAARQFLSSLPERPGFEQDLSKLLFSPLIGMAVIRGTSLFFTYRRVDENQSALYVSLLPEDVDSPLDIETALKLVDPNAASEDALVSMDWWHPSTDGRYVAYGVSRDGSEWSTLRVVSAQTGVVLSDSISRTRHSSVAWEPDNSGFYYTRYPDPGTMRAGEENYHQTVRHHVLGTDPSSDPIVFGQGRPRREMYQVDVSRDGRFVVITAADGTGSQRVDVYLMDRGDQAEKKPPDYGSAESFVLLTDGIDALFDVSVRDGMLYLLTNYQAPFWRVVCTRADRPQRDHWTELLAELPGVTLQGLDFAGDQLIVTALAEACSRLYVYDQKGLRTGEVALPTLGAVTGVSSDRDGDTVVVRFESFGAPPGLYLLDWETDTLEEWVSGGPVLPFTDVEVRRVFYSSRDGTRVPMFIVKKATTVADGHRPTVLTGYGGFNISRTPIFSPNLFPWLERGGVYALANLRGGSEYGEEWHRGGMLGKKQNVFDDFTAAAEYLIEEGYTNPQQLGISGRSNGGLLVGAALTQRPGLFGAVVCGVPLLDMLRYHLFLIAELWIPEYGSADDPEQYEWLRAYSPYHNVSEDVEYPPVFLFTAASDARVHPMHARKFAGLLQNLRSADAATRPAIFFEETGAGHGVGKPVRKIVEQEADIWAFLAHELGME